MQLPYSTLTNTRNLPNMPSVAENVFTCCNAIKNSVANNLQRLRTLGKFKKLDQMAEGNGKKVKKAQKDKDPNQEADIDSDEDEFGNRTTEDESDAATTEDESEAATTEDESEAATTEDDSQVPAKEVESKSSEIVVESEVATTAVESQPSTTVAESEVPTTEVKFIASTTEVEHEAPTTEVEHKAPRGNFQSVLAARKFDSMSDEETYSEVTIPEDFKKLVRRARSGTQPGPSEYCKSQEVFFTTRRRIQGKRKMEGGNETSPSRNRPRIVSKSDHNMRPCSDDEDHEEGKSKRLDEIKKQFNRIHFLLGEGFSVMLHGFGSKIKVMNMLKEDLEFDHRFIVNGLYPRINGKQFLTRIKRVIMEINEDQMEDTENESENEKTKPNSTVESRVGSFAEDIYKSYKDFQDMEKIFILIFNFDYLAIKHPDLTQALSILVQLNFINIIATTENINGYLGLDARMSEMFNFVWVDATTFEYYTKKELEMKDPKGTKEEDAFASKASLQSVLISLTENAKKAFKVLATLQLKKEEQGDKGPIEFRDIVVECKKKFIATNENGVRGHLNEFLDHDIIVNSGTAAKPRMLIEIDREFLREVIETIN